LPIEPGSLIQNAVVKNQPLGESIGIMGVGSDYVIGIDRNDIRIAGAQAPLKVQARENKHSSCQCREPHDEHIQETFHGDSPKHKLPGSMRVEFPFDQQAGSPC
jgi:hypothetical protein